MFALAIGGREASVFTYWFGSVPSLTYLVSLSPVLTEVCVRSAWNLRRFQSKWHFWSVLIGWRLTCRGRNKGRTIPLFYNTDFSVLSNALSLEQGMFFSSLNFRGENYHCLSRKDYSSFPFQISVLLWHQRLIEGWEHEGKALSSCCVLVKTYARYIRFWIDPTSEHVWERANRMCYFPECCLIGST